MDNSSKKDLIKAFNSHKKEELIKILDRNGIKCSIDNVSGIEDFLFPSKNIEREVYVENSMFKCNRCSSNRVTFRQDQTRATDEGVTSIFTCIDCSNTWNA